MSSNGRAGGGDAVPTVPRDPATEVGSAGVVVRLLESFRVVAAGRTVELPHAAQRLLAFLALNGGGCPRIQAATALWPAAPEEQAYGALRSTLWRLRQLAPQLVDPTATELGLVTTVQVDVRRLRDLARRLLQPGGAVEDEELDIGRLAGTLLPGWYDDWVLIEREQLHQLQLHGLQALAERFLARGSHGQAVDAALAAVRLDPLRESAHRLLVRVHLDEGNASEALRAYTLYRRLLWDELNVRPSARFEDLVQPLTLAASHRAAEGTPR